VMESICPIALTFLSVAGIVTLSILLFPTLALAGLTGFDLVTCNEWQRAFGWASFQIIFIPWANLTRAILLWMALALALMFGFYLALKNLRLGLSVIAALTSAIPKRVPTIELRKFVLTHRRGIRRHLTLKPSEKVAAAEMQKRTK
jgi:high-affinity nickel permease